MQALRYCTRPSLSACRSAVGASCSPRVALRLFRVAPFRRIVAVRAQQTETDQDVVSDEYIHATGDYCSIDGKGQRVKNRSIGEMEQDFLLALSSWYYDGKPIMSDEEFQILKDELLWNGSKVPILDKKEMQFLEASIAYAKGESILSDEEYDALKDELRLSNSIVTAQGPRCSIRTRKMYSDATADYLRMTLLNLPAALVILGVLFGVDYLTGFKASQVLELPPPYGVAVLWGVVLPAAFVLSTSITNVIFKDNLILKGPCPNCGTENYTYFGDIFTVAGNRGQNLVDCAGCNAGLTYDENKRVIVVAETPEERNAKAAAAAAKKAAAAAKKGAAAKKKAAAASATSDDE